MALTEKYLEKLALRKYSTNKGEYHLPTLLALQISHLPRHQELIRLMFKVMIKIADYDVDDNMEAAHEIVDLALECITHCEEISDDGLALMGYEIDEDID